VPSPGQAVVKFTHTLNFPVLLGCEPVVQSSAMLLISAESPFCAVTAAEQSTRFPPATEHAPTYNKHKQSIETNKTAFNICSAELYYKDVHKSMNMKESRKHRAILLNEMSDHKTALIPTARNNVLYQLHMCNT